LACGIGVRYSEFGLRALMLERSADKMVITGVAAGPRTNDINGFLAEHGFPIEEALISVGLGPGDFLSCYMAREQGMEDSDMEEQLRWELEKKAVLGVSAYAVNFAAVKDTGFLFAARGDLIEEFRSPSGAAYIVDVEPVALYNGCDELVELGSAPAILISVEAEGLSSTVLENGFPVAMESFSARQESWIERLPGLDFIGRELNDEEAAAQFVKYTTGCVSRHMARRGGNKPRFERIIIAGGGAYSGGLASVVAEKTGIAATVTDPFSSMKVRASMLGPRLATLGSAFTTCFGLALRAMGE